MTTTTITYSQPWFRNWRLYAGAIAIIILSQVLAGLLSLSFALSLILATQIVLFVLLFYRPAWAMAALMVGQFTASSYMISLSDATQITIRLLWTILAVFLLVPTLRAKGGIQLGSRARSIIIPAIIFYFLASVANIANVDMASTLQYLRTGLTAIAIVFFLPAVVKNEKDLKLLAIAIAVTCFASALAAIMQHYQYLGLPSLTLSGATAIHRGRALGLAEGSVHLAFQLPAVIVPMFVLVFLKGVSRGMRILLSLLALVMVAALYFTYTRSGMYSLIPGLLVMVVLLKGKIRKELLLIFIVLAVGFLLYTNMVGNRYSKGFNEESSAAGRLVLWQAGAMIALDHPLLGIGQGRFTEISRLYSSDVSTSTVEGAQGVLGMEEAHNDFIRVWVSFGTPALLVYLWIFINTFRNFYYSYNRASKTFLKALALGGLGALGTYVLNAFTHNLMDSMPLLWILAGFSLACVKLAESQKPAGNEVSARKVPVVDLKPDTSALEP